MNTELSLLVALISAADCLTNLESDDCTPAIADRCFSDFWTETIYSNRSLPEMCGIVDDKIQCSKDIIDAGCQRQDGRDNFDSWVSGLTAVSSFFCLKDTWTLKELVNNVAPRGSCFSLDAFAACIETKTKITHVADMLFVTMDAVECNWVMMAFATCGARVTSPECSHVKEIIDEVLQIFFQEVKCAYTCSSATSSLVTYTTLPLLSVISLSLRPKI
ncbi:Hypothetical protein NTJ_02603 [Nesidiocoris tenuis]|uniref:Uncharacterized protein n=1 Tax=Nesidiocoris tenuis TaxID=355587 RepID=A0ABN7ABY4_9HEMI|nr:Hypothetical protein NTJ_02603 [Nesidiocoris tenuis]